MASPHHDPTAAYGDILQEIVRQGLSLATMLHDGARQAETPADTALLTKAWHQITRGVRQTVALHSRLLHDRQVYVREFGPQIARDHAQQVWRRRTEVHSAIEQLIWTEHEKPEDADFMIGELFELLDGEAEKDSFLEEPVDLQIARLRHMLALDEHARRDIEEMRAAREPDGPDGAPPPHADSS